MLPNLPKEVDLPVIGRNLEVSVKPSISLRNTYIAAFSALIYIAVLGMVSGYSAPATADMKKPGSRFVGITEDEITWIASLPNLGGIIGTILSGFVSQKLGRKSVLIYISVWYVSGWLLIAYAKSVWYIYVGRVVCGFSSGISAVAVPAYVVEIATTEVRGFLTAGFKVFYSIGMLIMMSFGVVLRWSWLAVTAAVFVASGACLVYFMPESPHWLVSKSKKMEAIHGLKFLRGKNVDFAKEIQDINNDMLENPSEGIRFQDFRHPTLYKPIFIVLLLFFFQQFSGFTVVMSYTVDILASAGSSLDPKVAAAIIASAQLIMTIVSSLLMDRAGRKPLFIASGCFLFLSLAGLGVHSFAIQKYNIDASRYNWVPMVCLVIFISAYATGYGPIPFVMTPELVPIHSRSFVLAVGCLACSIYAFIVSKSYDSLKNLLGEYGLYWFYSVCSLLGTLYCFFFLRETKGKTINEINKFFSARSASFIQVM